LKPGGILAFGRSDEEDGFLPSGQSEGVMHHGFNRKKLAGDLEKLGLSSIQVSTVHTILKKTTRGDERSYPVFLMIAMKEKQ